MKGQIIRPLGHSIPIKQIILQEFEFVRNNPITSTVGATALGGALVHDYHKSGTPGIGVHIGNKLDSAKSWIHDATGKSNLLPKRAAEPNHVDTSVHHDSVLSQAHEHL